MMISKSKEKSTFPNETIERSLSLMVLSELTKTRQGLGMTQIQLANLSGVKQPAIARMEKGECVPNFNTLLKVLYALGKTLKIVSIEEVKPKI